MRMRLRKLVKRYWRECVFYGVLVSLSVGLWTIGSKVNALPDTEPVDKVSASESERSDLVGEVVEMTGEVYGTQWCWEGYKIWLNGGKVYCFFDDDEVSDTLLGYHRGDIISVIGKYQGKSPDSGYIIINPCKPTF